MRQLADNAATGAIDSGLVAARGVHLMRRLDTGAAGFARAVDASYESGNRYWLWQRLLKETGINGGVLNLERDRLVPLHDHPGATGMLRVVSGTVEVWQFDQVVSSVDADGKHTARLKRVSHRLMVPGDTAVLTPGSGNIHALRAAGATCSMLDFFVPPYRRSRRSWYEPMAGDWFDKTDIACHRIPEVEYTKA